MRKGPVVFIAFEERENLGIGYLCSVLAHAGYPTKIIDFRTDKTEILEKLHQWDPVLVGFSVIFETHIYQFSNLIEYLRMQGIHCHFTAGGHYASLRPEELFDFAPSLNSIVRFEGEHTLISLVSSLHSGTNWKKLTGISFKKHDHIEHNPLRHMEPDLDRFPFPIRSKIKAYALGKKYTILIAGRGCIYNCIFCDIREFYGKPPGPLKRIRNPERVVEEMAFLHHERDVDIFLFQDDDFPLKTQDNGNWVKAFCQALVDKNLSGKIMWKINCRPDEIDPESFRLMQKHGLFRVFLGIEDGTDPGLLKMNKKLEVSDHKKGIKLLKELGISIDFGFLLFQPDTTYQTLNENLEFLDYLCGDGYMPVTFLKMMPYMETRVEKELQQAGRLKGRPGFLDYDFNEASLNDFHQYIYNCYNLWINASDGFANVSKWVDNYLSVYKYYYGSHDGIEQLCDELIARVSDANRFLIHTLKTLSSKFASGNYYFEGDKELLNLRRSIEEKHSNALKDMTRMIEKVELYTLTRGLFMM